MESQVVSETLGNISEQRKCPNLARKICTACLQKWASANSDPVAKPKRFPLDFEGNCPDCGGPLAVRPPF